MPKDPPYLDAVLVVVLFALGPGDEVEQGVLDVVKLPPEQVRVLVEQGPEVAGGEADQVPSAVVEEGDPL